MAGIHKKATLIKAWVLKDDAPYQYENKIILLELEESGTNPTKQKWLVPLERDICVMLSCLNQEIQDGCHLEIMRHMYMYMYTVIHHTAKGWQLVHWPTQKCSYCKNGQKSSKDFNPSRHNVFSTGMYLLAVLGSQGIVVKHTCTAAIFFHTVD